MSSSGDRTTSVWDRRKLAPGVKPLATAAANNTILSAYFSPAGMPPAPHLGAKTALEQSQQMNAKRCMHCASSLGEPKRHMTEVPGKDADVGLLLAGDKSVLSTGRVSTLQLYDNLKDMF